MAFLLGGQAGFFSFQYVPQSTKKPPETGFRRFFARFI
jgi:hypothetical protein